MTWTSGGHRYRFVMSTEPNLWKVMRAPVTEDDLVNEELETAAGFLVTYVDDLLCLGPREVVEGGLSCIRGKWDCSPEEWVDENHWMKFCGMELRWKGTDLLIGQPSYARELLNRHGHQQPRSTPAPKIEPEVEEEGKTAEEVKQAQQVVGELLWLSIRTRPDLSYIVAWMGRHVARAPKMVCQVSKHVLGYLQETLDYVLVYSSCPEEGEGSLMEVVALSDASHAPGGGRGCQGIMMMWGNAVVQWEARAQPFAALSSTEAELIGYVDAMTMGESLGAIINALEGNRLALHGCYRLKGDNLSGLQLLVAPDGPWRTRHLRLRSYVLRERIASGAWVAEHVPGTQLSADLLTKPIVVTASWVDFRRAIGLIEHKDESRDTAKMEKLSGCLKGLAALSKVVAASGVSSVAKAASAIGLSTLAAYIHQESCVERGETSATSKKDLKRARCTGTAGDTIGPAAASPGVEAPTTKGEVEKRKVVEKPPEDQSKKLRENEPNNQHVPCMKALRMSGPLGRSASIAIAEAMEMEPPFDFWPLTDEIYKKAPMSGKDQWVRLGRGWWCKQHKEWRITSFNPIHRNVPFEVQSLVPERFTLCYWRDAQGRWLRQCHQDGWMDAPKKYLEGEESATSLQWIGYTFFKVEESAAGSAGSGSQPVIRSDQVDWRGGDRGGELPPPDRIAGGPKARAKAVGPITLRGSIRRSFPGGILPSQEQGVLRHRPGGAGGPGGAEGFNRDGVHPAGLCDPEVVVPTSGAYQPSATPYYSGGPSDVPYQNDRDDPSHAEGGESESLGSEVTDYAVEVREPGDPYRYMLGHVRDVAEDIAFRNQERMPQIGEGFPYMAEHPPLNGTVPRLAAMTANVHGAYFQDGLWVPSDPELDAFSDEMDHPGEAIDRLLLGGPAEVLAEPRGPEPRELPRRRVPAGHPEWRPPPGGGIDVEVMDDCPPTESDDGSFELLRPWSLCEEAVTGRNDVRIFESLRRWARVLWV